MHACIHFIFGLCYFSLLLLLIMTSIERLWFMLIVHMTSRIKILLFMRIVIFHKFICIVFFLLFGIRAYVIFYSVIIFCALIRKKRRAHGWDMKLKTEKPKREKRKNTTLKSQLHNQRVVICINRVYILACITCVFNCIGSPLITRGIIWTISWNVMVNIELKWGKKRNYL